jgi:hypothetical protein
MSPAEVTPPASAVCGGLSTLESGTGGEAALLPTASCGGEAVCASSTKVSPTTVGSIDLVREGEDGEPRPPCDLITGLHNKTPREDKNLQNTKQKKERALKNLPRNGRDSSLRPKHPRLNRRRHPCLRRGSSALRLQTTTEGIL